MDTDNEDGGVDWEFEGVEMGESGPGDVAPPPPPGSAEYKQLRDHERLQDENATLHEMGMTRKDYEQLKKEKPAKGFKRVSQARFEAMPEKDVDKALQARLVKSPETLTAFKKRCDEIKEFYDSTNQAGPEQYTMGRHREIVPSQAIAEARYALPPKPNGFFAGIVYSICAFACKLSLRIMNWSMRTAIMRAEEQRQLRINSLIDKLVSQMTDDNPETEKCWEQVSAVRSKDYEVRDGETEEQALQRELDEIAGAYDSSLWGDGRDSSSVLVTRETWKTVKGPSGRYHSEMVEEPTKAAQIHDRKYNIEDTIIVSPKHIDDPVLLRAKELKISELRNKKTLTEEERNQLEELTRSFQ